MFKFLYHFIEHVHCFCDKKRDSILNDGSRLVIMACNKCGLEDIHILNQPKCDTVPGLSLEEKS